MVLMFYLGEWYDCVLTKLNYIWWYQIIMIHIMKYVPIWSKLLDLKCILRPLLIINIQVWYEHFFIVEKAEYYTVDDIKVSTFCLISVDINKIKDSTQYNWMKFNLSTGRCLHCWTAELFSPIMKLRTGTLKLVI